MARRTRARRLIAVTAAVALVATACGDDDAAVDDDLPADPDDPTALVADVGVDVDAQVVRVGALNDESGPGAAIGQPFAVGKRLLVDQVNAGGSGLLPDGWTIELEERDHGYDSSESVNRFEETKDDVLFFFHSFGTPNTLPLMRDLEDDTIVAFPASLSTLMAENEYTPPIGAPYKVEAEQAVDWAIEDAGGAENVRLAILYQADDYGEDGLRGVRAAAEYHDIEVLDEVEVAPGETELTAPLTRLRSDAVDANYVVLTTLPTATIPILNTADDLDYAPTWLANTPAWVDLMFDVLPAEIYQERFRWVTSLPMWGEDIGGMDEFLDAFEQFGGDASPNFYILVSYLQGLVALEALSAAIQSGDVTRQGYFEALTAIEAFDAGGLFYEPANLTQFPYQTQTDTRILSPGSNLEEWTVVRDWSTPPSWEGIGE